MAQITPLRVALGIGSDGGLVEVTSYLTGSSSMSASWGQTDQFRGISAATFTFTLDNYDGRFTPGNPFAALATPIAEGTLACWQLGDRLRTGSISNFEFPDSPEALGRITITCDDVLGDLGRFKIPKTGFVPTLDEQAEPLLLWPLNDPSSSDFGAEVIQNGIPFRPNNKEYYVPHEPWSLPMVQEVKFGGGTPGFLGQSGMFVSNPKDSGSESSTPSHPRDNLSIGSVFTELGDYLTSYIDIEYAPGEGGYYGFWASTPAGRGRAEFAITSANFVNDKIYRFISGGVALQIQNDWTRVNAGTNNYNAARWETPGTGTHYYVLGITGEFVSGEWITYVSVWRDGVQLEYQGETRWEVMPDTQNPSTWNPKPWTVLLNVYGPMSIVFSRVGHFREVPHPELANVSTSTGRFNYLQAAVPGLDLTLSSKLSDLPIGQTPPSGSILDDFSKLNLGEQGYIYTSTTGTLLTPETTITVRERTRALTPKVTFDAVTELEGTIPFERNLTNAAGTVTVTGDGAEAVYTTPDAPERVTILSASETILNSDQFDLKIWGSDRAHRGYPQALSPTKIVIDSATTPTDRSSDLLALEPGDRVRITNINSAFTGFDTWDGWLIGAAETHTPFKNEWTLTLAPATEQGVYDSVYADFGGVAALAATVNETATTLTVETTGELNLSDPNQLPVLVQVDGEQMTAIATTEVGDNQVLTVVRGAATTTPAPHSAGATISIVDTAIVAF